jgi:hypothetical protein
MDEFPLAQSVLKDQGSIYHQIAWQASRVSSFSHFSHLIAIVAAQIAGFFVWPERGRILYEHSTSPILKCNCGVLFH